MALLSAFCYVLVSTKKMAVDAIKCGTIVVHFVTCAQNKEEKSVKKVILWGNTFILKKAQIYALTTLKRTRVARLSEENNSDDLSG